MNKNWKKEIEQRKSLIEKKAFANFILRFDASQVINNAAFKHFAEYSPARPGPKLKA